MPWGCRQRYSAASDIAGERHSGQPAIDELLQPGALGHVMHRAIGEVVMARARARQFEARMAARGPAMHHRVGDVGVKLQAERMVELECLDREIASLRQQFGAAGKFESLAVPMVDMIRPVRADLQPRRCRADRVISDLRAALAGAARPARRAAWRASARPGKFPGTAAAPCSGTAIQSISWRTKSSGSLALIGPPKMTAPAWPSSVSGSGVAKPRTPDIQMVPERPQHIADAARRRGFLVQDDQNRQQWSGG